ncbi:hypothetical protein Poli38472_008640 [Pythium oligandrum]|uniref:Uncharacterized protein n=1 Tax=Pythium oligandrum TaxID=41045 RepID=A0A8K1C4J1_PYTOL|nr:hypothetical protein Poli38472_008640 [Pythium oligandrum]|eukprot:TMW55992.1 hypothetical protein Poli38472_008640 [Pythium oligandrum]
MTDAESIDSRPWPEIVDEFERSTAPCGWDSTPLPVIAVQCNEIKVLEALHTARTMEPERYSDRKYSFDKTLFVCFRMNQKKLFRWLLERGVTSDKPFKLIKEIVKSWQWPMLNALFELQPKIFVGYTKNLDGVVLTKNVELVRFLLENPLMHWQMVIQGSD